MKRVLITGATGMVGNIVLNECINNQEITEIISISRKPTGINNSKLTEIIHNDFMNYANLTEQFRNIHAVYFCIGVYTGQVSKELFKQITVDYVKSFADTLHANSPNSTFCLLSGAGADPQEKSRIAFAKYKGMAENYLIQKNFGGLHIFRPAYIYPVAPRKEPNLSYRIFRSLYPVLKNLFPSSAITSEVLGKAIFKAGLEGTEQTILENEDIKKIVG